MRKTAIAEPILVWFPCVSLQYLAVRPGPPIKNPPKDTETCIHL